MQAMDHEAIDGAMGGASYGSIEGAMGGGAIEGAMDQKERLMLRAINGESIEGAMSGASDGSGSN